MNAPPGRPLVVALGGNALVKRGEPPDVARQRTNVEAAATALAAVARDHRLVITHGNGPQVGVLALQSEASATPFPLDVLGAETEGMIGYLIEQALGNRLPGRQVATLLTQVLVDADDPAFGAPTKPIGPIYAEGEARRLAGSLHGAEAVIDKDLSAALLAERLGASMLVMLTDVEAVIGGWGTPAAEPIRAIDPDKLRTMGFASGSMAPKAEAACRFVEATGGTAAIGSLAKAEAVVRGESGTRIAMAARDGLAAIAV